MFRLICTMVYYKARIFFMLICCLLRYLCLYSTSWVSNSWTSGGHLACWQSCRGAHDGFDLEITTSPDNGLCNAARDEVDLQKKVITSSASPHHRSSSGIVNQKSSSVTRSGVDLQIKKMSVLLKCGQC